MTVQPAEPGRVDTYLCRGLLQPSARSSVAALSPTCCFRPVRARPWLAAGLRGPAPARAARVPNGIRHQERFCDAGRPPFLPPGPRPGLSPACAWGRSSSRSPGIPGAETSLAGSTVPGTASTDYPWEPPLAGTEVEHLTGALDRLRTTFRWKADDLDAAGLQARIGASALTLGGLLKHLAAVEDYMFTAKLSGEPLGAPVGRGRLGRQRQTGSSPPPPTTRPSSSTRCGTAPSSGPGPGSARPWPTAGSTSSSTPLARRRPRQPAPARLRPDRGVRPAHRARRPAPRGGRRTCRRGPAAGWRPGPAIIACLVPRPCDSSWWVVHAT